MKSRLPYIVIIVFLALVAIYGLTRDVSSPASIETPSATSTSPSAGGLKPGWSTFSDAHGFQFDYPTSTFTVSTTSLGVLLSDHQCVIDNPSGIPGKEKQHCFSAHFEVQNQPILTLMKKTSDFWFKTLFPDGTEKSFTPDVDAPKVHIPSHDGYSFRVGVEGINTRYIFFPIGNDKTLLITFKYIGDVVGSPKITEQQQKDLFQTVLDTLTY